MEKLWILDGYHFIIRNFHGQTTGMLDLEGNSIDGVLGFFISLFKMIIKKDIKNLVIVWDNHTEDNIRIALYPEYKSKKEKLNITEVELLEKAQKLELLKKQITKTKDICKMLGFYTIEIPKYEADDIIYNICKENNENNKNEINEKNDRQNIIEKKENNSNIVENPQEYINIIVTADKDMNQLLNENTYIYNYFEDKKDSVKKSGISQNIFIKEFGFSPKNFVDYLALVGDSSDNIPGASGIGPQKANLLIQEYKDIETIYKNIDKIDNKKIRNSLTESKENVFLSKKLASFFDIENFVFKFKDTKLPDNLETDIFKNEFLQALLLKL